MTEKERIASVVLVGWLLVVALLVTYCVRKPELGTHVPRPRNVSIIAPSDSITMVFLDLNWPPDRSQLSGRLWTLEHDSLFVYVFTPGIGGVPEQAMGIYRGPIGHYVLWQSYPTQGKESKQ